MSITKGLSFGVAEQVTNTKLHNLVDDATISLEHNEFATNVFTSLASAVGVLPFHSLFQGSLASGVALRYDGSGGTYFA